LKTLQKEELVLSGESYRNFVCSVNSKYIAPSYPKVLRQFMEFHARICLREIQFFFKASK